MPNIQNDKPVWLDKKLAEEAKAEATPEPEPTITKEEKPEWWDWFSEYWTVGGGSLQAKSILNQAANDPAIGSYEILFLVSRHMYEAMLADLMANIPTIPGLGPFIIEHYWMKDSLTKEETLTLEEELRAIWDSEKSSITTT